MNSESEYENTSDLEPALETSPEMSNDEAVQGLLSLLDLSEGFTIAFVECNFWQDGVALVAALSEQIENDPEWEDLQILDWEFTEQKLRLLQEMHGRLEVLPKGKGKKLVLVLRGLENAIGVVGDYPQFLADINFVRDGYIKMVPHPVVFVLPDYAITRFAKYAPDFWAWKSGAFKFKTAQKTRDFAVAKVFDGRVRGSYIKPEKQERINLLHRLLMEANPSGSDPESNRNASSQINILLELGLAYDSLSEYNRAIEFFEQALEISRKFGNRNGEAKSLNSLGNSYDSLVQYQQAIHFYQQSLEIFREIGDLNGKASSLNGLGSAYKSLGQYQQAIQFHQQSLEIKRELGDLSGEAGSLNNLGNAYDSLGQYQQTIQFYQQSLEIFRGIGDRNGEGSSLCNLGNAYCSLGQYQQAIQFYQQSLEIFREIGNRNFEANSLSGLGLAYDSLGQYQQAIHFLQQSLEIKREIGDHHGEAVSLNNLGSVYGSLGQYHQTIQFYQKSLEIKKEIGDLYGEASSLGNLGSVYGSLGQYQQAIHFLQQSLEICREIGDRHGEANSLHNLGLALKEIGRRGESIEALNASRKIYEELGLYNEIKGSDKSFAPLETVAKEPKRFILKEEPKEPDWYAKSQPNYKPTARKRTQNKNIFQQFLNWFRRL
jgi:tetratricopeptide (TPR) repeat protein